jgi:organic radical activating enzyme
MTYKVHSIFRSIQGEGMLAGIPAIFVRFHGCNLSCSKAKEGFDCDTKLGEELSELTMMEIIEQVEVLSPGSGSPKDLVVMTGGEPTLQMDLSLVLGLLNRGYRVGVETNGTVRLDRDMASVLSWITLSPKLGAPVKLQRADEVKYVVPAEGEIPWLDGSHIECPWFVQPAWSEDEDERQSAMDRCVELVLDTPLPIGVRLGVQLHKILGIA